MIYQALKSKGVFVWQSTYRDTQTSLYCRPINLGKIALEVVECSKLCACTFVSPTREEKKRHMISLFIWIFLRT